MSRLAVCLLAAAATAQAATTVYQASFDQPNHPWATVHSAFPGRRHSPRRQQTLPNSAAGCALKPSPCATSTAPPSPLAPP